MIRSPIGYRINPDPQPTLREAIRQAARLGARGIVLDAAGDLAPQRLTETGRRELRYLLRSVELGLVALSLPTRRPFDTPDGLDDRLNRADGAFGLAYELGTRLVLVRVGGIPAENDTARREAFTTALRELARRADHRGVRLAIETGSEPGETLANFLETLGAPSLAASVDPASLLRGGHDPVQAVRALGSWVAHAYANDATGSAGAGAHPRGYGFPAGALDWEEYLGALEEVDYRGYLTIWPDPAADPVAAFNAIKARLDRF
jgi:sugar phosphate isomerase/epimerase